MVQRIVITRLIKYGFDVKEEFVLLWRIFLYHFFHTRQIFSARPTSTVWSFYRRSNLQRGRRGLITAWPSIQRSGENEEIADICVWPENGLILVLRQQKRRSRNHRWGVEGVGVYCRWDLIRSKQLSSGFVCRA